MIGLECCPKNDGGRAHAHSVERRILELPDGETVAALLTRWT
jgi:hypothetical protein